METSLKVPNPWTGSPVFVRERTSSTMDDARALALGGCAEGTVVLAGFQEKGKGRAPGRSWHSKPWDSLMATVVLNAGAFSFPLSQLPLRVAVAVSLALEESGACVQIKWPNDLLVEGKKIAGILCEMCGASALVGFGVNCGQAAFPGGLAATACSILQCTGRSVLPVSLLPTVLARVKDVLHDDEWRGKLLARLSALGEHVTVALPQAGKAPAEKVLEGTLRDVDGEGRLVLEDSAGTLVAVAAGELRIG
jgi:BirA family biotin operon repressor/biotin-[acetyl-CoA-carboxylase] ligase